MQDNGNVWRKYRVVPRAYPSHPLICAYFHRVGNKERFRLPGAGGGSFPLYGGTFARSYSVSNSASCHVETPQLGGCKVKMTAKSLTGINTHWRNIKLAPIFFRAARVQNETAPEKFLNRYEKRFEKREKGSEKRSETRLKKF